jgi:hypothetical protein
MEAMLRRYYGASGNGAKPAPVAGLDASPLIEVSSGVPVPTERGQLKKMVIEVLEAEHRPITTTEIASLMRDNGFQFNSQRPYVAVNEALNNWAEEDRARVHHTNGRTNFWVAIPVQENTQQETDGLPK